MSFVLSSQVLGQYASKSPTVKIFKFARSFSVDAPTPVKAVTGTVIWLSFIYQNGNRYSRAAKNPNKKLPAK